MCPYSEMLKERAKVGIREGRRGEGRRGREGRREREWRGRERRGMEEGQWRGGEERMGRGSVRCYPLKGRSVLLSQELRLFAWARRPRHSRPSLPCTRARPCTYVDCCSRTSSAREGSPA